MQGDQREDADMVTDDPRSWPDNLQKKGRLTGQWILQIERIVLQSTIHSTHNQLADLESDLGSDDNVKCQVSLAVQENQLSGKQNPSKSLMQREAKVRLG